MDLVADCGSSSVKVGYSGDDSPSVIMPSAITKAGNSIGKSIVEWCGGSEGDGIHHPIQRGRVVSWEHMHKLWSAVVDELGVRTGELNSVLVTEPPLLNLSGARKEWAAMLFESFQASSVCFMNSAPLVLFASGRTSGVAVDIGAGLTSVVPVFEGLALAHASQSMDYGGQDISHNLLTSLKKLNLDVEMGNSYARSLKEKMAFVHRSSNNDSRKSANCICTLPDGTEVSIDAALFSDCTEPLIRGEDQGLGLLELTSSTLARCDGGIRPDLACNVVLAGGTSFLPGLGDRLVDELQRSFSAAEPHGDLYIRVLPTSSFSESGYTSQRKVAAWVGGSIVSSFSAYKDLRVTREEWEESGEFCLMKHSLN